MMGNNRVGIIISCSLSSLCLAAHCAYVTPTNTSQLSKMCLPFIPRRQREAPQSLSHFILGLPSSSPLPTPTTPPTPLPTRPSSPAPSIVRASMRPGCLKNCAMTLLRRHRGAAGLGGNVEEKGWRHTS